jgi:RNA polymerase-binding transcription factor DksA
MKKNISKYKIALEKEKNILVEELQSVGGIKDSRDPDEWQAKAAPIDTIAADPNETADKIEAYEENAALISPLEARLTEIDRALDKLEKGTYGNCEVCGKEIEVGRLDANPAAARCSIHMNS